MSSRRLRTYQRFGAGAAVGHRGGRYVWQLADSHDLVLAWIACDAPAALESDLLRRFHADHGRLPFANLRH